MHEVGSAGFMVTKYIIANRDDEGRTSGAPTATWATWTEYGALLSVISRLESGPTSRQTASLGPSLGVESVGQPGACASFRTKLADRLNLSGGARSGQSEGSASEDRAKGIRG